MRGVAKTGQAIFKSRIDRPPSNRMANSFLDGLSLKKQMPRSIDSKITPMLRVGKKTADGSRPAKVVFKRLQQPKHTPITEAAASLFGCKREAG